MKDINTQRQTNFGPAASGYPKPHMADMYGHALRAPYMATGASGMGHHYGDASMSALATGMGGMNIHPSLGSSRSSGSQVSGGSSDFNNVALNQPHGIMFSHPQPMVFNQLVPAGNQAYTSMTHSPGMYNPYMQQGNFQAYPHQTIDNSPLAPSWTSRVSTEIPSLISPTRRDSISSNEQDLPATPYTGYNMYHGTGVTVMDRSPSTNYPNSCTPSPSQLAFGLNPMAKPQIPSTISPQLLTLIKKEPAIPRAIPAPSSPVKPLDRSLENKNGETNVYIRGLLPETTDEMLQDWGIRFGDIQSSKSIIDLKTGLCKGFGFIKYHNYKDAENCIRGFHFLGYEVSFARESFYAKLKKFADEHNTNLYISNLPKTMNEHELGSIFHPYKVCSSRILRDSAGNGRGVGFARFENRDTCEEIIKRFNNTVVRAGNPGDEDHTIQIRYADTQQQKLLKQTTAAGRQFRAAEYDFGVAQLRNGTTYSTQQLHTLTPSERDAANEFEAFLRNSNNTNQGYGTGPRQMGTWATRSVAATSSQQNSTPPTVSTTAPSTNVEEDTSTSDDGKKDKTVPTTPVIESPSSKAASEHE